jgi:YVTN family beta-propeller protein
MHLDRLKPVAVLFLTLMVSGSALAQASADFQVLKKLPLEGGGRWDYVTTDPDNHRVYVARSTHVTVVDSESGAVVGDIPDTKGVHGVAVAPDLGLGFISVGGENKVVVFDLKTLQVDSNTHLDTGGNPDSILYYPPTHSVFVQNGRGNSSSVIDAVSKKIVATIPLGDKPEYAVYDDKGNIFINLEKSGSIAVVDAVNKTLKTTWKIAGCEAPSGLALDRSNGILFAGCTDSKVLAIVNSKNGQLLQTLPIGADCDGAFFDPSTGYAFASTGDGKLTVVHRDGSGNYSVVQNLDTMPGSKTMGYDPTTHRAYLTCAKFTGDPTSKPRPATVPGSIALLVVGQP